MSECPATFETVTEHMAEGDTGCPLCGQGREAHYPEAAGHAASQSRVDVPPVEDPELHLVALMLCDLCLDGKGGECHVPGCALNLNRAPDLPLRDKVVARLTLEPVE